MTDSLEPPNLAGVRRSLAPLTLLEVSRLDVFRNALDRKRQREVDSSRRAVFITGEGGLGKSVLLGQILQAIETDTFDDPFFNGAVVLVSCADVIVHDGQVDEQQLDEAFGKALASQSSATGGLLSAMRVARAHATRVTLLIDTLDLIIEPRTRSGLGKLLAAALAIGDVIVTCREDEYRLNLEDHRLVPSLTGRIEAFSLPKLEREEVLAWASRYVNRPNRRQTGEESDFLIALETEVYEHNFFWQVCRVPVRLAMACDVFEETGHLPQALTVVGLYDAYWKARVSQHAGPEGSTIGRQKSSAAMALAEKVLDEGGNINLRIPVSELSQEEHASGLFHLASEGVVVKVRRDTAWEFFHQTFAEFACARWLLSLGPNARQVSELGRQLSAGRVNLWSIAGSLLSQLEDYDDYIAYKSVLPMRDPEGAKAYTAAALSQRDARALFDVVEVARSDPGLWLTILPELANAPRTKGEVPRAVLTALATEPALVIKPAVSALLSLLSRAEASEAPQVLEAAIGTLMNTRSRVPGLAADQHMTKLINTQKGRAVAGTLTVLSHAYRSLDPLARGATAEVYMAAPNVDPDQIRTFADEVFRRPWPPLNDGQSIQLLDLFWQNADVRAQFGWTDWIDLLGVDLGNNQWTNAKLKFLLKLCDDDSDTRADVVDQVLEGRLRDDDVVIQLFNHVARDHSEWMIDRLLSRALPADSRALGALANSARSLRLGASPPSAIRLLERLTEKRMAAPRQVWPAQVALAGDSITWHRRLMADLLASGVPSSVKNSAADAWVYQSPVTVLRDLTPSLRTLLESFDTETLAARARLEGRLLLTDPSSPSWLRTRIVEGQSLAVARTAAKAVADCVRVRGSETPGWLTEWLSTLLMTVHASASQRIAEVLSDSTLISDRDFSRVSDGVASLAGDRLVRSLRQGEDSQVVKALLDCLIRADRYSTIDPSIVREASSLLVERITGPEGSAASVAADIRRMALLCGTLMARMLPAAEIRSRLEPLLVGVNPGRVPNSTVKGLSAMLFGVINRDPGAQEWLESTFERPDVSAKIKLAIAQAFVVKDHGRGGGRASRLRQRPNCPPEVASYLVNNLS